MKTPKQTRNFYKASFVLMCLFLSGPRYVCFSQASDTITHREHTEITHKDEKRIADLLALSSNSPVTNKHPEHKALETELEIYPLNVRFPKDAALKNEAMFDYHIYSDNEKYLGGIRFFTEVNTHYTHDRDMSNLLMYTEAYYGFGAFQMGAEIGSITGEEYISAGPQLTIYDNVVFKRVSILSRLYPDLVFGYEFTTQELEIFHCLSLSATGMSRILVPSDEQLIQGSVWLSFEKLKGFFIGLEYEYNNAEYFNSHSHDTRHELFFGIKFELK